MPTYTYIPTPPPLSQEELDRLAAEQVAMGGAVPAGGYQSAAQQAAIPPPPTSSATAPVGGDDQISGYSAGYGAPSTGQAQGYDVSSTTPQAAPHVPEPAQPVGSTVVPSEVYGGVDPNAPRISTGLIETFHPSTGNPPTATVVPSGPRAAQDQRRAGRFAGAAEAWQEHPVERSPLPPGASGFNTGSVPGGPGNFWRRTPAELSAFRSSYRLEHPPARTPPPVDARGTRRRPPTEQIIQAQPLPVERGADWDDFFRTWWQEHGFWPNYRTRLQDDLGAPLWRGGPRRSG